MWFPVEKYVYQVQSSVTYDSILDPADLDLDTGYSEPELCFLSPRSEIRLLPYLTVERLTFCLQDTCFQKELDPSKSLSILQ